MTLVFIGIGTLVNVVTVAVGALTGLLLGNRIPDRTKDTVTSVLGLFTMVLGGLSVVAMNSEALGREVGRSAMIVVLAALGVLPFANPAQMAKLASAAPDPAVLAMLVIATGIVKAVIPFLLYTLGLERTEPSRAAILATSEPMMATVLGVLIYGEAMNAASLCGVACILAAILLLNRK